MTNFISPDLSDDERQLPPGLNFDARRILVVAHTKHLAGAEPIIRFAIWLGAFLSAKVFVMGYCEPLGKTMTDFPEKRLKPQFHEWMLELKKNTDHGDVEEIFDVHESLAFSICRASEEVRADLIVMPPVDTGLFGKYFSRTEHDVIRKSGCSVFVAR